MFLKRCGKILLFLMLIITNSFGQKRNIYFIDIQTGKRLKTIHSADSAKTYTLIYQFVSSLRKKGYLAASADSIFCAENCTVKIFVGQKYILDTLRFITNDDTNELEVNKIFSWTELNQTIDQRISQLQNQGYPLAQWKINKTRTFAAPCKNFRLNKLPCYGQVLLNFDIDIFPGQYFAFDTVYIPDTVKLSKRFLSAYLNIRPGKPYNKQAVELIPKRINQLSIAKLNGKIHQEFYNGLIRVVLPLKIIPSNSIEALVGLKFENNKLSAIGRINLNMKNFFKHAEDVSFSWEKPHPNWQQMKFSANIPYILGTPIGSNLSFFAQKIDTTQFNINLSAQVGYYLDALNYVSIGMSSENFYTNTNTTNQQTVHRKGAIFSMKINNLFPVQNPTQGYWLNLKLNYGTKSWADSSIYSLTASFNGKLFIPAYKNLTFMIATQASTLQSPKIFDNEQIYLGGYDNFLGFDQNSFKAWQYWLLTFEPRLTFYQKSNIFIFTQAGKIYSITNNQKTSFSTKALGIGLNLKSKNSIISITYAMGALTGNPFNPQSAKIHLSYKALF